jgi:hypothetical protein
MLLLATVGALTRSVPAGAALSNPGAMVTGFDGNTLSANDDGSTGIVNLPFSIDFFGNTYSSLYVNNNGNVTFNSPLSTYTPSGLTSFGSPIIAPFWGDVDTAVSGSNLVTYGTGTVDGHTAFGVNWPGVDCYATTGGGLNYFQMLIVDRSDIAAGDFDIEYNYGGISWDSGQASSGDGSCLGGTSAAVGYSNGTSTALELAGSFVDNAFLDGGPDALVSGSQNSSVSGRYIFPVRSGGSGSSVGGTIDDSATPPNPVSGALVSVCGTGGQSTTCYLGNSGTDGSYSVLGVADGTYVATVSPPSGSALGQLVSSPFTVTGEGTTTEDFTLTGPTPPPNGTVVTGVGSSVVGGVEVPVINWGEPSPITTNACPGGTVTATLTAEDSSTGVLTTLPPVALTESPPGSGSFSGTIPAVYPLHGAGTVAISITNCPSPSQDGSFSFSIYIDPSGLVVDGSHGNAPVAGATVTLLSSDSLAGTFVAVPNGSAVMSPGNRVNPDTSRADGTFGWDTVPGYYEVQATKAGCGTATTAAFQVPPPNANLQVVLHCSVAGQQPRLDTTSTGYHAYAASSVTAGPVSTTGSGELLVALVQADGSSTASQTVRSVTGAGLTWHRASWADLTGAGSAEVWQAYAPTKVTNATVQATFAQPADGLISVESFTGAAHQLGAVGIGSTVGGPARATITPTSNNSLVIAGGLDWSSATRPAPVAGQSLVTSFIDSTVGDWYWTQAVAAPTVAGTPVTVKAGLPSLDRWSLVAVEIPPAS